MARYYYSDPSERVPYIKLVTVGDGAVGKTSLLYTYCRDTFPTGYVPTVFDSWVSDVTLPDGQMCQLAPWDTAGIYIVLLYVYTVYNMLCGLQVL